MICSSIDIGTNSVLLLVADKSDKQLIVVHEDQQIPRLGQGVDRAGSLSNEAQNRVLAVLKNFKLFLEINYPEISSSTIVTATSAVRDAANRKEFMDIIYNSTGWRVMLLSGDQEARVTFNGALSVLDHSFDSSLNTVLDIGGGSTEIAAGMGKTLNTRYSLNMGSVRFTERFFKSDPPDDKQIVLARKEVRRMLTERFPIKQINEQLIGVAGTVTSMAGIDMKLKSYDTSLINGYRLSLQFIESMIEDFKSMTANEIEDTYPVFLKGRGDVISGGLIILSEYMRYCNCEEIIVSTGGIRHGILLENIQQK